MCAGNSLMIMKKGEKGSIEKEMKREKGSHEPRSEATGHSIQLIDSFNCW